MFTNVTISNFRTFEKVILDDLGRTTALIGRNASGKSNLLHALEVFGRTATEENGGRVIGTAVDPVDVLRESLPAFEAVVSLSEVDFHYKLALAESSFQATMTKRRASRVVLTEELDWRARKTSTRYTVFTRADETISFPDGTPDIRTGRDTPALVALSALLPVDSPIQRLTKPLQRFLGRVRYYPLDEPARGETVSPVVTGAVYNNWVNEYRRTGVLGEPVPVQILHLALTEDNCFSELKRQLGRRGLRLIDDVTVRGITGEKLGQPRLDSDTGQLDPNALFVVTFHVSDAGEKLNSHRWFDQLSQGTRRLVRLLTAMAYGDNSVMLIEHPEDGIHRGLLKKVMGLFTTGFCPSQIFLSTHSDTVLNGLAPEAIRFVGMDDGKSTVRKMTPAEQRAAREYIDSDAEGTLAEFAHSIED